MLVACNVLRSALGLLVLPDAARATPRSTPTPATTCDLAYGCDTSTTEPDENPSCSVEPDSAQPGTKVTATLKNVPLGTEALLLFDGVVVGKKTATADGQGAAALAPLQAGGHLSVRVRGDEGGVAPSFFRGGGGGGGPPPPGGPRGRGCVRDPTLGAGVPVLRGARTGQRGRPSKPGTRGGGGRGAGAVLMVGGAEVGEGGWSRAAPPRAGPVAR